MKDDQVYLRHILDAIEKIESYVPVGNPEISWCVIAGFRDILIHYFKDTELAAVWEIAKKELPVLKQHVQVMMKGSHNSE